MRISTDKYTEEELLRYLAASSRVITYKYIATKQDGTQIDKELSISDGVVSFNSKSEVMRTFTGSMEKNDYISLKSIDYRLIPYMGIEINGEVIWWALGKFIIKPAKNGQNYAERVSIVGYDLGKLAYDDKLTERFFASEGGVYTSYIGQLLGEVYGNVDMPTSEITRSYDQEWEPGASRLDVANTMLHAIGYTSLYFDELGIPTSRPYQFPQVREIERTYDTNIDSVFLDDVSVESSAFDVPNKFVRYTKNVDAEYLIAEYVNDNPDSPYSIQKRGRTIVDSKSVNDIASQQDLNNYTQKIAIESMQATETLQFYTLNMPGHGYQNCLAILCEPYDVYGKYIETAWEMQLYSGGRMKHICERVQEI